MKIQMKTPVGTGVTLNPKPSRRHPGPSSLVGIVRTGMTMKVLTGGQAAAGSVSEVPRQSASERETLELVDHLGTAAANCSLNGFDVRRPGMHIEHQGVQWAHCALQLLSHPFAPGQPVVLRGVGEVPLVRLEPIFGADKPMLGRQDEPRAPAARSSPG